MPMASPYFLSLSLLCLLSFLAVGCNAWEDNGNFRALSRCNVGKFPVLEPFLRDRWNDARVSLGMEPVDWSRMEKLRDHFRSFNFYSHSTYSWNVTSIRQGHCGSENCRDGTSNDIVTYARIVKCGSEGISGNIGSRYRTMEPFLKDQINAFNGTNNMIRLHEINDGLGVSKDDREFRIKLFTFVRDPLQRFEAGLCEAAWYEDYGIQARYRSYLAHINATKKNGTNTNSNDNNKSNKTNMKERYEVTSTEQVEDIFRQVLEGHLEPLRGFAHVYPLSGVFFHHPVDVYGSLESMHQDWDTRVVPLFGKDNKGVNLLNGFDNKYGHHVTSIHHPEGPEKIPPNHFLTPEQQQLLKKETEEAAAVAAAAALKANTTRSGDPNNMRQYFQLALSNSESFRDAICNLLIVDYICLPQYPLPAVCQRKNQQQQQLKQHQQHELHRQQGYDLLK